jgi:predicted MFS family arabinose efflux permease
MYPLESDAMLATSAESSNIANVLRSAAVASAAIFICLLPQLLVSIAAPDIRNDLGFGADKLGIVVAAFFTGGCIASRIMGRAADRVDATHALALAMAVSATTLLFTAFLARHWIPLALALAVSGAAQALVEPAANEFLRHSVPPSRLGIAFGIRQSAAPVGVMVCGLGFALTRETIGWRALFAILGAMAMGGALVLRSRRPERAPEHSARPPATPVRPLLMLTIGAALASSAGSGAQAYFADSATALGFGVSNAALLIGFSGALAVAARLITGVRADRRQGGHLRAVGLMVFTGAIAFVLLALQISVIFAVCVPIAFIMTTGWPGLIHLALIERHPRNPSSATGTIMTGIFLGAMIGPLSFGLVVGGHGYAVAWLVPATWAAAGSAIILFCARRRTSSGTRPKP